MMGSAASIGSGLVDKKTMRDFDVRCLTKVEPLSGADIQALRDREARQSGRAGGRAQCYDQLRQPDGARRQAAAGLDPEAAVADKAKGAGSHSLSTRPSGLSSRPEPFTRKGGRTHREEQLASCACGSGLRPVRWR